jgi:hypothetical protein
LFCHCFCQQTLILILLSYSSRFWSVLKGPFLELEIGHGLTGAGARLDIWMVFCIQAFRKTAGFDLEISCGWFPLKRDRLRKQQKQLDSFLFRSKEPIKRRSESTKLITSLNFFFAASEACRASEGINRNLFPSQIQRFS